LLHHDPTRLLLGPGQNGTEVSHERLDAIAWQTIRDRKRPERPAAGITNGGRARDFAEVEALVRQGLSLEDAFESWLREMYLYRLESFFAVPPSYFFNPCQRAWMAGAAEGLARKLNLPIPLWVNHPQFFLDDIYDWEREALGIFFLPEFVDMLDVRLERSDPEFRRRGVIAHLRDLIRV
jgi:hypothetical protein